MELPEIAPEDTADSPVRLADMPLPARNREIARRLFCCLPVRRLP